MKYIIIGVIGLLSVTQNLRGQDQTLHGDTTVTFRVEGLCDMCQERIEKSLKRKGVLSAHWSADSKLLEVHFDPALASLPKLHQWVSEAGHDTELRKARKAAYDALPECCRYREAETVAMTHPERVLQNADTLKSIPASPHHLSGIVLRLDRKGNFEFLPGASVFWVDSGPGTLTDSTGYFSIPLQEQHRKLVVSFSGYRADTISVTDQRDIRVVLAEGNALKAVEVTARQRSTMVSSLSTLRTQVMTEKELFKAACCNLSESFETNPSVDVSFNDALTGSKQIQLLGLSGNYSLLTLENMPGPRGLATPMGLNYVPGPWIESIQISKGVGSVVNGFEGISGQINVELKKPEKAEPLFANIYVNDMGKVDLNLDLTRKINPKWSTALLVHDNFLNNTQVDFNKDGFRDVPTGNLFTLMNRWKYDDGKGFQLQLGIKYLKDDKTGGQSVFKPAVDKFSDNVYGLGIATTRWEGFMKVGYVFPGKKYKSIGWQLSSFDHSQGAYYGFRQYDGSQRNWYSNLIYQSIISNTSHKFRTGLSVVADNYRETFFYDVRYYGELFGEKFSRNEMVAGGFFEYTYNFLDKFSLVAGIRADHNNLFGWFATPRLHVRYEPVKGTVIRLASGRGQRTANLFAEQMGSMASQRSWLNPNQFSGKAYGMDPEVAWNSGITIDQVFSIGNRNGGISADYYYTHFSNKVVADFEDPQLAYFYNLDGRSFSSSFQVELHYELLRKLELRMAWRHYEVKNTYRNTLLEQPLLARNRAFLNLAWEVGRWKFDYTLNSIGSKRIPPTSANPPEFQLAKRSPSYYLMNAQVARTLGQKKLVEVYLGGENLTNYFQRDLILSPDQPFGPYFDASLVWGPVYGRMFYSGIRWKIK